MNKDRRKKLDRTQSLIEEREQGPVEILCREISYHFDPALEHQEIFIAFVRILVDQISNMHDIRDAIARALVEESTDKITEPGDDFTEVLSSMRWIFDASELGGMITRAAETHDLIRIVAPEEAYPCNHFINMLSSCVSAVRFGLEKPCKSRHAAAAAQHIWEQKYGILLFDSFTPAWEADWARAQLRNAILGLALNNVVSPRKD